MKILFKLTGSIACFKACAVISKLVQDGHQVQTVTSDSAKYFIGAATLEGLTAREVLSNTFAEGKAMAHIDFVKWADITVLCPATANRINQFAGGIATDLIGNLFLAHDFSKPYLVFPAMNTNMLKHPATQASLQKLQTWGLQIFNTDTGMLACGDNGEGRLLEPESILQHIRKYAR